jgi:tetratricopeptide (TPR) repeat protein
VLQAPGEATETTFRREIRGQWFAWLAAHEEGDPTLAAQKVEEIVRHAKKIGLKRLTDLSLAATLMARKELAEGNRDKARWALDSAIRLDPDLPEARWSRVALALETNRLAVPREFLGAVRTVFVDLEGRRVLFVRSSLLVVLTLAAVGAAFVVLLVAVEARRLFHDLTELAGRWVSRPADSVLAAGLLVLPLFAALDVGWLLLWLFVLTFGYAEKSVRWAALAGLVPLVLVAPALDRAAAALAVSASPVLRGAEALQEKRYDQRVLDDLEAVKNLFPEDADLRFLLGCLYQQLGQNDRAVAEYTVAAQVLRWRSRAHQPGGHPLRGRRLRRRPGGLPGGAPSRPARRTGPLQPLARLRRDVPDRGVAGEADRGAGARQCPGHALPRQPDAREGRLPRLFA